ncbi:hypothetical protein [Candidatus Odyssella thessalonicensis]|uniref:hypothetical protein n=1 Tax=Candidatus Odyssella thessalonicensis TaxID=84647 RepID=UPI000225ABBD|nr:hypothetical protein [Candidatus Odyssella thessalonicensis]
MRLTLLSLLISLNLAYTLASEPTSTESAAIQSQHDLPHEIAACMETALKLNSDFQSLNKELLKAQQLKQASLSNSAVKSKLDQRIKELQEQRNAVKAALETNNAKISSLSGKNKPAPAEEKTSSYWDYVTAATASVASFITPYLAWESKQ